MKNKYKLKNNIDRLLVGKTSLFLTPLEYKQIKNNIKMSNYKTYLPYKDSEKVIIYKDNKPNVSLYKINSYEKLTHREIMGSIYALNISENFIGDIIVDNDNYYFYILSELKDFIKDNLNFIGNKNIKLEEIELNSLENYERKYEYKEIIVSSIRIDNVISKIINTNRNKVLDLIKDKEVILNYEILLNNSYNLKENDIFSIRRKGKYKYIGIKNNTKSNNFVIKYLKYI